MLTRRHIRVKVLQSIYAYNRRENPDIDTQEKLLKYSIDAKQDLYLLMLQLLASMQEQADRFLTISRQKHLATEIEKNPSHTFVNNKLLNLIASNSLFIQTIQRKKLNYWEMDSEYVNILFNDLKEKDWYQEYLSKGESSFKEDQKFVLRVFKEVIAPNDKLYEYLEDKRLTWIDDFPLVNTAIVKMLGKISEK